MKRLFFKSLFVLNLILSSSLGYSLESPTLVHGKKNFKLKIGEFYNFKFENSGGAIDRCRAYPSLPEGLILAYDCTIYGIPKETIEETKFFIVAYNKKGSFNRPIKLTITNPASN